LGRLLFVNVQYYERNRLYLYENLNIVPKSRKLLPKDRRILDRLGENLRLARLRRKYSAEIVAERAGISRTTLWSIETGNSASSLSTLIQILSVYGLENDLISVAEDDRLGRKIQDAQLRVGKRVPKK